MKDKLKVYVKTRPNLRADEMTVFVGQQFLINLFDKSDYDMSSIEDVMIYYPERWLNILEQRALLSAIETRCTNIKTVTILTHSVYIIQCTPNGCLFIIDKSSDYPEISYSNGVRYCPEEDEVGLQFLTL